LTCHFNQQSLQSNQHKFIFKGFQVALQNNYADWSKEDLIKKINALEKRKKYGLVWDAGHEPEKVILDCQKLLPVLRGNKDKEITSSNDNVTHILIEGDNYHALSVLNYTHEKSIDLIYIDPPYNTGNDDFIYNDRYINREDPWRKRIPDFFNPARDRNTTQF